MEVVRLCVLVEVEVVEHVRPGGLHVGRPRDGLASYIIS
jgi:hypothetical protein